MSKRMLVAIFRSLKPGRVLALLFVCLCAGLVAIALRFSRERHAYQRMELAILNLADHRPDNLTDDQWAFCLLWTWNLHCNYGTTFYIPASELEAIANGLEERADGGVATIDWVWDQFQSSVSGEYGYERYRPTAPANREMFEAGAHGSAPLSWWQQEHRRRAAQYRATR